MTTFFALQDTVKSGTRNYPIFIGFLSAKDLSRLAEAPSFFPTTTHEQIATNILSPPVKEWQRPLDDQRVQKISAVFNTNSEFMPNPVLLSQNGLSSINLISIRPLAIGGQTTPVYEVKIDDAFDSQKPLWILDGQHRIAGLAGSSQKDNPVPLVLLINWQNNSFSGSELAKIFAQVTTEAKKLDPLHDAWLTFAFGLNDYSDLHTNYSSHKNSMTVVSLLCRDPHIFPGDPPNPFQNKIKFNPNRGSASPVPGGFEFSCIDLKKVIFDGYYNSPCLTGSHLSPNRLAKQIVIAHKALANTVRAPLDQTVFFGTNKYEQKIMQEAWLYGIFKYLLKTGVPNGKGDQADWEQVFKDLMFHSTDWNFSNWVMSLGGHVGTRSKTTARKIFLELFSNGAPPTGVTDLADYFRGDLAKLIFHFSKLTTANRASKVGRIEKGFDASGVKSQTVADEKFVKLVNATNNVSSWTVTDRTFVGGVLHDFKADLRKGFILDSSNHGQPLKLFFTVEFYGGISQEFEMNIKW